MIDITNKYELFKKQSFLRSTILISKFSTVYHMIIQFIETNSCNKNWVREYIIVLLLNEVNTKLYIFGKSTNQKRKSPRNQ